LKTDEVGWTYITLKTDEVGWTYITLKTDEVGWTYITLKTDEAYAKKHVKDEISWRLFSIVS
jgi:hypothetical protein